MTACFCCAGNAASLRAATAAGNMAGARMARLKPLLAAGALVALAGCTTGEQAPQSWGQPRYYYSPPAASYPEPYTPRFDTPYRVPTQAPRYDPPPPAASDQAAVAPAPP